MENKLNIYNTLSKRVEKFVPNEEGKVFMYTCGPTVYHFAHIGNLRSYICEDVLEKTLRYIGYDVKRVMNITDVGHLSSDADTGEDKMLAGAKREHKTVMEIAKYYTNAFFSDCAELNIKTPDVVEPATNCINEFIHMIEVLLEKGYAYVAGENVYFDTSKLSDYYVLTGHSEENLMVGVRDDVEEDTNKRNKNDFVLWFTKSKFEDQALKWDSPWGVGYPGWHIECSCISMKHIGEYMDIHCGGVDNIFPHHTNEIAQSESYSGHKWCNYWFHVHHLNDKSGKMSKSKGEFLTVSIIEGKGYDPKVYRMFCLQSHYRKPLEFSYEVLDQVKAGYEKLKKRIAGLKAEKTEYYKSSDNTKSIYDGNIHPFVGETSGEGLKYNDGIAAYGAVDKEKFISAYKDVDRKSFEEYDEAFVNALCSDINTAGALTVIYDVLKADTNDATKKALIESFDYVLGLGLCDDNEESDGKPAADPELVSYIEKMIAKRKEAKKAKDFATADAIREELAGKGISIKDTREGTVWELN